MKELLCKIHVRISFKLITFLEKHSNALLFRFTRCIRQHIKTKYFCFDCKGHSTYLIVW